MALSVYVCVHVKVWNRIRRVGLLSQTWGRNKKPNTKQNRLTCARYLGSAAQERDQPTIISQPEKAKRQESSRRRSGGAIVYR